MASRRDDGRGPMNEDSPESRRMASGGGRRGPRNPSGAHNSPGGDNDSAYSRGGVDAGESSPADRGDRRGGGRQGQGDSPEGRRSGRGGDRGPRGGGRGGQGGPGPDDRARDEPGKRHQGFVRNLKDSYGFLQAADSEVQYFFHFSELRECVVQDLRNGTEVEYSLCFPSRPNEKIMAVRVCPLPKGTIKLEEEGQEGVIVREMRETRGYDRDRRKEAYGGRVKLLIKEPEPAAEGGGSPAAEKEKPDDRATKSQIWQFGGEDVAKQDGKAYTPQEGDVVKFDVVMTRTTRQQRATNIVFVSAPPAKEEPRETGVLATVKDSYGFIKCADRDERLFFHISELINKEHMPRAGDEIEFSIAPDRDGRNTAVQIKVLPKGSVSFVATLPEKLQGVVERALKVPAPKKGGFGREERGSREPFGGMLVYEEGGKKDKLQFDGSNLADSHILPLVGDTVEFQICVDKPTKKRKAVQVRVVKYTTDGREQGVLSKCKSGMPYSFIKCCDREEAVFLFQSEFQPGHLKEEQPKAEVPEQFADAEKEEEKAEEKAEEGGEKEEKKSEGQKKDAKQKSAEEVEGLAAGDEVEFNVVESRQDGKLTAIRVVKLAPGSVSFEKTLEGRFEGVVEKALPTGVSTLSKKALRDPPPKGFIRPVAAAHSEEEDNARRLSSEEEPEEADGERHGAAANAHDKRRERGNKGGKLRDPEAGLVSFTAADADVSVSLQKGDRVEYTAIMDKPSKKQRATKMQLVAPHIEEGQPAEASKEGPEEGVIASTKHHHGFIRCANRDLRLVLFFQDVDAESLAQAKEREDAAKAEKDKAKADAPPDAAADGAKAPSPEPERAAASPEPAEAAALSGEEGEHESGAAARGGERRDGLEGHVKGRKPRIGDEVSFYILSDPTTRVLKAVEAKVLPKGTVVLETVAEERHKGVVVERDPKSKDGLHACGGSVRHGQGESHATLHFSASDLREPRHLVFKGDTVEYCIATDKASGERSARDVVAFPTEGIVESVKDAGNGMVRADEGVNQDKEKDKAVAFAASDVEKGDRGKLEKGCDVSFFYGVNAKTKEICAVKVKRIFKERPAKEKMPERMKRQQEVPKAHSRLAAGPDGTKGFNWTAMGLGRAKPQPKSKLNVNVQEFVPFSPAAPTDDAAPTAAFPTES